MSLSEYIKTMLPAIEADMRNFIKESGKNGLFDLHHMLSYHMGWEDEEINQATGKRIRPIMLLLTTEAAGGSWEKALPAASAVELIHNFSLIHDDIQDNSSLRRGRETIWKKWGKAQAINAGDAMFALAHMALGRLAETVDATIALSAFRILPKVSLLLTQGQFLDLSYEGKDGLSENDYWPMIAGKTAALLSACSELGALIAGCSTETVDAYREFGYKIGMAYQVYDDVLGIWGDAALIGKSTESDLLEGKKSLPILYCIAHSEEFSARWKEGNIKVDEIAYLADLMEKTGAKEYSLDISNKLTNEALDILENANPQSPAKDTLTELAYSLINRQK